MQEGCIARIGKGRSPFIVSYHSYRARDIIRTKRSLRAPSKIDSNTEDHQRPCRRDGGPDDGRVCTSIGGTVMDNRHVGRAVARKRQKSKRRRSHSQSRIRRGAGAEECDILSTRKATNAPSSIEDEITDAMKTQTGSKDLSRDWRITTLPDWLRAESPIFTAVSTICTICTSSTPSLPSLGARLETWAMPPEGRWGSGKVWKGLHIWPSDQGGRRLK